MTYRVVMVFSGWSPWWYRLAWWAGWRGFKFDKTFALEIYQGKERDPLEVACFVGKDALTTKVTWKNAIQLVRKTSR